MTDISTNGWDVISITDLNTINKIINSGKLYPSDYSVSDIIMGVEIVTSGKWGTWQITSNASGRKVNIRCEIKEGTVAYLKKILNINNDSHKSYIEIELSLKGIHSDTNDWVSDDDIITDSTRCYQLMIDADESVVISDSKFTGQDIKTDAMTVIVPELFQKWFDANLNVFDLIFSVIIIGLKAKNSDVQWLYPSAYSYAVNSSIDKSTTGFGVMTLIDGKTDIGTLQQSVDIAALRLVKSFGGNLALVVSKEMFVKHILLKAAVSLIKNAHESDFTINDTGLSLTNNREMVWQDFDTGQGHTISPTLPKDSFILTLQSDYINITILDAHYRPRIGVTVTMSVEQNFRYKVEKNHKGEPVFVPDEKGLGDAQVACSVKFDKWLEVLEITTGVIASVAGLISLGMAVYPSLVARATASVVEEDAQELVVFSIEMGEIDTIPEDLSSVAEAIASGAASNPTIFNVVKIASVITAATTGITFGSALIAKAIYKGNYNDVPSFHHFSASITGSSVWPHTNNIVLKSASLADSFVIGLEIK